jgi:nitrite reductase (NO-forming)
LIKGDGPIDIVRDPADIPPPVGKRGPERVKVDLDTVEATGKLSDGSTYRYWTFNEKVPGPFIRVRVGDTVEVHLHNDADNTMVHNVDMHAVTGPGGGSVATETAPGDSHGLPSSHRSSASTCITARCRWRRSTSQTACSV